MGEAKRRKKLDPLFGVAPSIQLCESANHWQLSTMAHRVFQGIEPGHPAKVLHRDAEWDVICSPVRKNGETKVTVDLVSAQKLPFPSKQLDELCAAAAQQILEAAEVVMVAPE